MSVNETIMHNQGDPYHHQCEKYINYMKMIYSEFLKEFDVNDIIMFDRDKLQIDFISNYRENYDLIKEDIELMDRHKECAVLVKSLLDAYPFYLNVEKAQSLLDSGNLRELYYRVAYPTESIAVQLCKVIINSYSINVKGLKGYDIKFADILYAQKEDVLTYESEFIKLISTYKKNTTSEVTVSNISQKTSMYSIAHILFNVEVINDITFYGLKGDYFK